MSYDKSTYVMTFMSFFCMFESNFPVMIEKNKIEMDKMKYLKLAIILIGLIVIIKIASESSNNYSTLEVINDEVLSKSEVKVLLNEKIDESELKKIGSKIQKDNNKYERVYIFYYLSVEPYSGLWALTNYTPDLDIVMGASIDEELKLKSIKVENVEMIGKWYEEELYTSSSRIIYIEKNKTYMLTSFIDGSSSIEELKSIDNIRFDLVNDIHGEYFKIDSNSNLAIFNKKNEKFAEFKKY